VRKWKKGSREMEVLKSNSELSTHFDQASAILPASGFLLPALLY
jgi:hypothetical protein